MNLKFRVVLAIGAATMAITAIALMPDNRPAHERCMDAMDQASLAIELCEPLLTASDQPTTGDDWNGYPVATEFPAEDGYFKVSLQDGTEFTVDTATGHVTVSTPDPDDCDWIWYGAVK